MPISLRQLRSRRRDQVIYSGWPDVEWLTINAMKSAFIPFDERLRLINTVIKPGFAAARAPGDPISQGTEA